MADAGLQAVLDPEEKGSLRPEMGKAAFPLGFRKEEVPHMMIPTKLDELHLRNMAELWADGAESRNGRRLLHNSGLREPLKTT
jgi:hypothetical protein